MEKLVYYFIYFFVFSVVGYICEVTYVYICNKKLVNRGFLHGPYIPIYGNGAIFITLALGQCKNVILVFLGSMLICSILEYVTSYVMEVIFHNRWWDYSKQKFNINGRVCLNYGGRAEIIDAIKKIRETNEEITEENFGKFLYQDLPDLDLVIRTSGEERISNFMLWQISYAEFYFPSVYFPDFDEEEFEKALLVYNKRDRRFGGK